MAGLVLASMPLWLTSAYLMQLVNVTGINVILALGLLFIFGYCGQLSLCQAAFFGVGAYTTALLTTGAGVNPWLGMASGAVVAGLLAAVVGTAILHLKGHYFALASFGFGEMTAQILLNWKALTGGTDGVLNIPKPAIFGFVLGTGPRFYYFILALIVILALVTHRINRSRYGRAFLAVRSDPLAAQASGLDVFDTKRLAFILSGVYGGIGGAVYAHLFSFISPDVFGFMVSVNILVILLIGGTGHLWGVLVGSLIVTALPEALRFSQQYYMLFYGALITAVVVLLPGGISSLRSSDGVLLRISRRFRWIRQ